MVGEIYYIKMKIVLNDEELQKIILEHYKLNGEFYVITNIEIINNKPKLYTFSIEKIE